MKQYLCQYTPSVTTWNRVLATRLEELLHPFPSSATELSKFLTKVIHFETYVVWHGGISRTVNDTYNHDYRSCTTVIQLTRRE